MTKVKDRRVAVRQHWDADFDISLSKVGFSCRLVQETHEGRPTIEESSVGTDVGWVLWNILENHREGLSAWSPAFPCVVAGAPSNDPSTVTRTRTARANTAPILLPDAGGGVTDARFVPKRVEDLAAWMSKPFRGLTGTMTAGMLDQDQDETFHPDFWGLASASRNADDYATNVFDLDENGSPDVNYIAPLHTGLVVTSIEEVTNGGGIAVGDALATPLNSTGRDASSGGGYVYIGADGSRDLIPMSWEAGGPITWSNPAKHQIGHTLDGAIMPAAISTAAFFRGPSTELCGPLPFVQAGAAKRGHWSATDNIGGDLRSGTQNEQVWIEDEVLEGYIVWDPSKPYSWAGGADVGAWKIEVPAPASQQTWDGSTGGTGTRTRPVIHSQGGAPRGDGDPPPPGDAGPDGRPQRDNGAGAYGGGLAGGGADAPLPPSSGGDGGLPRFGHASGRRPGGESQAEVNARFSGFSFGIGRSGAGSTRNQRRSPLGGFGLGGGGGSNGPPKHTKHGTTVTPPQGKAAREAARAKAVKARLKELGEQIRDAKSDRARDRLRARRQRLRDAQKKREDKNKEKAEKIAKVAKAKSLRQRNGDSTDRFGAGSAGGVGAGAVLAGTGSVFQVQRDADLILDPIPFLIKRFTPPLIGNDGIKPNTFWGQGDIVQQGYQDFGAQDFGFGSPRGGGSGSKPPIVTRLAGHSNTSAGGRAQTVSGAGGENTSGGTIVVLPPGGTIQKAINKDLSTVGGTRIHGFSYPSDVSGNTYGTHTDGGEIISGTQVVQFDDLGLGQSPINSAGTIAPSGFEVSLGPSTWTLHGAAGALIVEGNIECAGKLSVEGLIDPTGLVLEEQGSDPMAGSQVGIYAGNTAGANEAFWRRDDGSIVDLASGAGGGGVATQHRFRRVATQSLGNNTATFLSFDTEDDDDDGGLAVTSTTWTCQTTGIHIITAKVAYSFHATGHRLCNIAISSGAHNNLARIPACPVSANATAVTTSTTVKLTAADTVKVGVFQNSGATLTISGQLTIVRLPT